MMQRLKNIVQDTGFDYFYLPFSHWNNKDNGSLQFKTNSQLLIQI